MYPLPNSYVEALTSKVSIWSRALRGLRFGRGHDGVTVPEAGMLELLLFLSTVKKIEARKKPSTESAYPGPFSQAASLQI